MVWIKLTLSSGTIFSCPVDGWLDSGLEAAGPTTRIVDCYKSGVVDVNKEISMISDDSVEECPFSETSPSGTTWVLKTRVIEKNTHHFFNAKFSEIARRFQKCKS